MKIKSLITRYKGRFLFTATLVLLEAGLSVLFPLFIGFAIDDILNDHYQGAFLLGGLGLVTLFAGAGRRFFDTRFYAKIYTEMGVEMSSKMNRSPSKKTARLSMLGEVVEFFENSVPELVNSIIGLFGVLIIVSILNIKIFAGCLVILVVVLTVYALSEKRTVRFNTGYNNELERQVDVINQNSPPRLRMHLQHLMKWNIRLSDLETINFSISWTAMMGFLVTAIILLVDHQAVQYGAIFALVMYLFEFIQHVITLPFFYQQWLRLAEITQRLKNF